MWFSGDIGSAVATVQNESKILLVFGLGKDELSKEVDLLFQKSSQNLSNELGDKCICLKLEEGSEGFKQFCEFWPILTTPIIYFIAGTGAKLCEPIIGDRISESSILQAISPNQTNTSTTPPTVTSNKPSTSKMENPEETEEQKKERIAARAEEYREKIEAVRKTKEDDFKQTEKQKEQERREAGQQIAEQKKKQEEEQLLASAKEKRKDKKDDKEYLKKLRAQIAEDRANKSKEYETISKEEREQKEEQIRQVKNENIRLERERLEEQRKMRDTMARIQFRFSDGSCHSTNFEATQKLADARKYIVDNGLVSGSFILGVALPRRRFNTDDEETDFRSLGLTPFRPDSYSSHCPEK